MRLLFSLLSAMAMSTLMFAQSAPCINGFAAGYPCEGYDLVSHLDITALGGDGEANDIWGWVDPETAKEYAIVGLTNGTAFVDLCDGSNPELVGFLPSHTTSSIWRDIKVYADHAFIVSEASGHGMQVFDLTQLEAVGDRPAVFSETAHNDSFGKAHNIAVNEETGYAYVIGAGPFSGGPMFINIQDPENPVNEGGYSDDGYTHDAQIVVYQGPDTDYTGSEIFFGSNENTLTIVDVTDKSDPEEVSVNGYPNPAYAHQGWLTEDQRYFIMNDELDEQQTGILTRTLMFDCLDLDAPVYMGAFTGTTTAIDHNMYVKGDLLYQSNYTAGLRVIDISDIADGQLEEVGYFDVHPNGDANSFNGAWSVYPYFESGLIVVNSIEQGLFVVKASAQELVASNCVATAIDEIDLGSRLQVYPNPTADQLNVSLDGAMRGSYVLRDAIGREMVSGSISDTERLLLDLNGYGAGTYILSVTTDQGVGTRTVIVE